MRFRRFVRVLPVALLIALTSAPDVVAAARCTMPAAPTVKAVWAAASSGPQFRVTPASAGGLPIVIRYQSATYDAAARKWSAWSTLVRKPVANRRSVTSFAPPLTSGRTQVALSAYAENVCGRSARAQVQVPLARASELALGAPTLAQDLPLKLGTVPRTALFKNTFEFPFAITSSTTEVCTVDADSKAVRLVAAGDCTLRVSQQTPTTSTPNPGGTVSLHIEAPITPLPSTGSDRPDELTGFQIHVVYVTLADVPGRSLYADGHVNMWVQLAQDWLERQINKRLRFDTYEGTLDVTVMRSAYRAADLPMYGDTVSSEDQSGPLARLTAEYLKQTGQQWLHGKNLLFIVDAKLSTTTCGLGGTPGSAAMTTPVGEGCWEDDTAYLGTENGINWASATILHEFLHNTGVDHTCIDETDLMLGADCVDPTPKGVVTLDATRTRYVGASASGADILAMKVWTDGSGTKYVEQEDTCYIGAVCALPREWWTGGSQPLQLQQLVNGAWQTVATFPSRYDPVHASNPYTYDVVWTATATGDVQLRYRLAPTAQWGEYIDPPFTIHVPY